MKRFASANLLLLFLLASCTHYYYVSNVQNVPLFREKNEFRISGTMGGGDESTCMEAQTAVAASKHLGLMAGFMYAEGGDKNNEDHGDGYYAEGALGYFTPVRKAGSFEIYAGGGASSQYHRYSNNSSRNLNFVKGFIQPSLGFRLNALEAALSSRLSVVNFYRDKYTTVNYSPYYPEGFPDSNCNYFFIEPAFTLRAGWKNVKAQFQLLYVNHVFGHEINFDEETHFSIGLYLAFGNWHKPK